MRKKKIAIIPNVYDDFDRTGINSDYLHSIVKAGGYPIMFSLIDDIKYMDEVLKFVDGIVITGGVDLDPLKYGEEPKELQGPIDAIRDTFDLKIIDRAIKLNKGILGICRGHQIINVYFGGTLHQDISYGYKDALKHSQQANKEYGTHTVEFLKGSKLHDIFGDSIMTNTYHHQAIKDLGKGVITTANSKDGVIEGIEVENYTNIIGVQWHPEKMLNNNDMNRFFKYFIDMI